MTLKTTGSTSGSGTPRVTVINKGVPGRTSLEAIAALDQDVLALQPQRVILFFGMNDAMNSAKLVPLAEYDTAMRSMVRILADAGVATIVLVTLNPVIEFYVRERHAQHPHREDLQGYLAEYDRALRAIADENHLSLVDLRRIVEENGGTTISESCLIRCAANGGGRDGVHLTAPAYEKLGVQAFDVLKEHTRPGDKVVCFGDSLTYGGAVKGEGTSTGETYPAVLQLCFDKWSP